MFLLMTSPGTLKPTVLAEYATFEAAVEAAHARFKIVYFEADDEHEGCADFLTQSGLLYAIEPVDRRKH